MKYLDARFRQPEWMMHPMQRFARNTDAVRYEELRAWNVAGGDAGTEFELFYVEADRERYEAKLNEIESVRWYNLTPVDEDSFYLFVCQETREADVEWRTFTARGLLVVPPIVFDDAGEFHMTVVGEGADLRAMLDELPEEIAVTVTAVGEYDRRYAPIADGLSDRQLEAVEAAVRVGFYDYPRTGSLAEVASELDCAESTASTLLQRAEASLMERLATRHGRYDARSGE